MELKLSQSSSLPTAIFNSSVKHCTSLAQQWELGIQRIHWKGPNMSKKHLVHVIKEGETLSSISTLYGVPILELIAVNKDIVNVDAVLLEGQHLKVPSAITGFAQTCHFEGNKLYKRDSCSGTPILGFSSTQQNQFLAVASPKRLALVAKTHCSFLFTVPMVALCVIVAFQNMVSAKSRYQASIKSGLRHGRSNTMRWRAVLDDSSDPNAQPESYSELYLEAVERLHHEETPFDSRVYTKVEDEYKEFLSECGMSNWGYWRGGSPK